MNDAYILTELALPSLKKRWRCANVTVDLYLRKVWRIDPRQ